MVDSSALCTATLREDEWDELAEVDFCIAITRSLVIQDEAHLPARRQTCEAYLRHTLTHWRCSIDPARDALVCAQRHAASRREHSLQLALARRANVHLAFRKLRRRVAALWRSECTAAASAELACILSRQALLRKALGAIHGACARRATHALFAAVALQKKCHTRLGRGFGALKAAHADGRFSRGLQRYAEQLRDDQLRSRLSALTRRWRTAAAATREKRRKRLDKENTTAENVLENVIAENGTAESVMTENGTAESGIAERGMAENGAAENTRASHACSVSFGSVPFDSVRAAELTRRSLRREQQRTVLFGWRAATAQLAMERRVARRRATLRALTAWRASALRAKQRARLEAISHTLQRSTAALGALRSWRRASASGAARAPLQMRAHRQRLARSLQRWRRLTRSADRRRGTAQLLMATATAAASARRIAHASRALSVWYEQSRAVHRRVAAIALQRSLRLRAGVQGLVRFRLVRTSSKLKLRQAHSYQRRHSCERAFGCWMVRCGGRDGGRDGGKCGGRFGRRFGGRTHAITSGCAPPSAAAAAATGRRRRLFGALLHWRAALGQWRLFQQSIAVRRLESTSAALHCLRCAAASHRQLLLISQRVSAASRLLALRSSLRCWLRDAVDSLVEARLRRQPALAHARLRDLRRAFVAVCAVADDRARCRLAQRLHNRRAVRAAIARLGAARRAELRARAAEVRARHLYREASLCRGLVALRGRPLGFTRGAAVSGGVSRVVSGGVSGVSGGGLQGGAEGVAAFVSRPQEEEQWRGGAAATGRLFYTTPPPPPPLDRADRDMPLAMPREEEYTAVVYTSLEEEMTPPLAPRKSDPEHLPGAESAAWTDAVSSAGVRAEAETARRSLLFP